MCGGGGWQRKKAVKDHQRKKKEERERAEAEAALAVTTNDPLWDEHLLNTIKEGDEGSRTPSPRKVGSDALTNAAVDGVIDDIVGDVAAAPVWSRGAVSAPPPP